MSRPSIIPDMGPNPFYDGPAIHKHQDCSYCHRVQRCEFQRLQRCARCSSAFYCSKECQRSHWKQHKINLCDIVIEQDEVVKAQTGIARGYTDLSQWVEFYSTPMKNCMVAALNLPSFPHQERDTVLSIQLSHKRDSSLPVQHRFNIDSIARMNRGDEGTIMAMGMLDSPDMKRAIEFGKVELGNAFYGTAMIIVFGFYSMDPMFFLPIQKCFSIDKSIAATKVAPGPWWPPLRHILENGEKMKFCCGKIAEGVCCCGGWLHKQDAPKGDAWRSLA